MIIKQAVIQSVREQHGQKGKKSRQREMKQQERKLGLIAYHCSALRAQIERQGETERYNREASVEMTTERWKERQ